MKKRDPIGLAAFNLHSTVIVSINEIQDNMLLLYLWVWRKLKLKNKCRNILMYKKRKFIILIELWN